MAHYDEASLRQMQGQPLINNMKTALQIFEQEEGYQQAVNDQLKYLRGLKDQKDNWSLAYVMKHPSAWMLPATGVIASMCLYFVLCDDMGFAIFIMFPFAFLCAPFSIIFLLKQMRRLLKKIANRSISSKIAMLILLATGLLILMVGGLRGLSWIIVLLGLLGVYGCFARLDRKFINASKWNEAVKEHFKEEDEAVALELNWRYNALTSFQDSEKMEFARAAVPPAFWEIQKLTELLSLMQNRGIYSLPEGTNAYYVQKGIDAQLALEQERLWEAQRQTEQQRAQTAILERQRMDNQWHNKEMQYQQKRANEKLDDIYREQKEHNERVERGLFL